MPSIDLSPIPVPPPTILQEVRTSKLRPLGNVLSGIDKRVQQGKLYVSKIGLPDDEHDLTFHGGVDKAIHQYNSSNYKFWHSLFPEEVEKSKFVPGGFGENLVADVHNESNICIGDLVRIGTAGSELIGGDDGCLLEVSLPRQPCFKLNQRFGIKNFAPKTHSNSKTGWYYRVKEEGYIEDGMEIRVLERPNPTWSIERLHHYVHRDTTDLEVAQKLMDINVIGDECRGVFKKRWEDHVQKEQEKEENAKPWPEVIVASKTQETPRIVRLELTSRTDSKDKSAIPFGSHALIKLPNGLKRAYSVVGGTLDHFVLGVAHGDSNRGGSAFIHNDLKVGDIITHGPIKQTISANGMASHYVFIVGGIGITAFLSLMKRLHQTNASFHLHYAVRRTDDVAFQSLLSDLGSNVTIYDKSKGERMDIAELIKSRPWNSHVYTCGPSSMINAVTVAAKSSGMAEDEYYYEQFSADTSGDPFTAQVVGRDQDKRLQVPSDKTLLEVLREVGFEMGSSCEVGSCGTCKVRVKCGKVEHRGTALTEEEKQTEMLACVSRGIGDISIELPED